MDGKLLIDAQNVFFTYEENSQNASGGSASGETVLVLNGVTVAVNEGEFVALLGHNGSGKSSLAKLFNAMELPTGGKVFVKDMDTLDEDLSYEIRRTVGMVLQNPDNQIVSTIVEEDIAFGPENLGVPPAEIRQRVDESLKAVGMYEYRLHEPHRLSGGQKQRVAIAGVLAMMPQCIVLDESTAMLDPYGRTEVLQTISRLNKDRGIAIVLITHNMEEAVLADRVIVLEKGKVVLEGTPHEVFAHSDKLLEVELDVPQPTKLCELLRKNGVDVPPGVLTIDECADEISKAYFALSN